MNQPYSGKSVDVYALGVVGHMAMGGYLPFKDGGVTVVFHPERWSNASERSKDFIAKCCEINPMERLSSEQLREHLFLKED